MIFGLHRHAGIVSSQRVSGSDENGKGIAVRRIYDCLETALEYASTTQLKLRGVERILHKFVKGTEFYFGDRAGNFSRRTLSGFLLVMVTCQEVRQQNRNDCCEDNKSKVFHC